jgi:hypothetical protein
MEKESIINRLDRLNQLRRYKHGWLIDDNNLDIYIYSNYSGKYIEVNLLTDTKDNPKSYIKYQGIVNENLGKYIKNAQIVCEL